MYAIRVLLVASSVVATTVSGKSFQNFDGSNPAINFGSTRLSPQSANIIGFNHQNRAMPHSVRNFNPLSSSMVSSSQPVFRPAFSNRNSFGPRVSMPVSFGRPLPTNNIGGHRVSRNPATQFNGIAFNEDRSQQGGSLNAGAIHFARPVETPVSFSNKPMQPANPQNVPLVPISFGGGPVAFPNSAPSIGNKPIVTNVPDSIDSSFTDNPAVDDSFSVTGGDPAIFFPGGATEPSEEVTVTDPVTPSPHETDECLLKRGTINFDGSCEILLSRASCPEDYWLLMDEAGSPYCSERQCPWGQLHYRGDCVDPGNNEVCNRGHILYVDFTGLVECDCEPGFIFDSISGNCYGFHEQGFCDDGLYLEQVSTGEVTCVVNPCVSDKYVEQDGVCYEKNYRGYCPQNQVMVLPQLFTADCQFLVPHSIFTVPNLTACPRGSRRDFFNKCRGVFRVPSQSSLPSLRGDCPTNFVKDPRGTCRKVLNLFG